MSAVALAIGAASAALTLPSRLFSRPVRFPLTDRPTNAAAAPRRGAVVLAAAAVILAAWRGPVALAAGLFLLAVGRHHVLRGRQRQADRRLVEALPALLHDIARRLRAGYSAPLAFAEVLGQLSPDQPGQRGAALLARGEPLNVVVSNWRNELRRRVGPTVLDELVGVVSLADTVGGLRPSAIEVLADLASERQALAQEVGAQASQAKASAVVMTIAPLIFSAQMVLTDPKASRLLLRTSIGWSLIGIGVTLDALAWLWIRRLTGGGRHRWEPPGPQRWARDRSDAVRTLVRRVVVGRPLGRSPIRPDIPSPAVSLHCDDAPRVALEMVGRVVETTLAALLAVVAPGIVGPDHRIFGPSSTQRRRRIGLSAFVLPPLLVLRPVLGIGAVVVLLFGPHLHTRSVKRSAAKQRSREVASMIELVRLALESGSTPSLALVSVAALAGPGLRPSLSEAGHDIRRGVSFDAVLRRLATAAPELASLGDVLVASSRLGLGVAETLLALAVEARSARRREAETAARRLPVVLLFPVVCLTLPAFIVLTVAPLLLSGLGALHF